MKEIPLSHGKVALVDDGDYEMVFAVEWYAICCRGHWYARNRVLGYLHRLLMNAPTEMKVDHRDGDGLNCQRRNMRLATHAQNMQNRKLQVNNTSGYRGVSFNSKSGKWHATIKVQGRVVWLGAFSDKYSAAAAFQVYALRVRGEFVRIDT